MPHIVGLAGALRKGSYNAALLRAAAELAPPGTSFELVTPAGFPPYDGDLESEHGIPEPVARLKDQIAGADGLLIATPEYNHSIPGVLKNAIDWLSRPPKDAARVFGARPVAILGATPGMGGTRLAQAALLPVLRTLGTELWTGKQLYVAGAGKLFDAEGKLTDDKTRELLSAFVAGFAAFAANRRLSSPGTPPAPA